ncbi:hypothetical protein ACOSQ4_012679 [Xanthoceras sorbifolium]
MFIHLHQVHLHQSTSSFSSPTSTFFNFTEKNKSIFSIIFNMNIQHHNPSQYNIPPTTTIFNIFQKLKNTQTGNPKPETQHHHNQKTNPKSSQETKPSSIEPRKQTQLHHQTTSKIQFSRN